jgi:hypothetical protein
MGAHAGAGYYCVLVLVEMDVAGEQLFVRAPAAMNYERGDLTWECSNEDWTGTGSHDFGA